MDTHGSQHRAEADSERSRHRWTPVFSAFVAVSSLLSVLVGAGGFLGLKLGIAELVSVVPGSVEIKANTCVCFVLLGISLWLRRTSESHGPAVKIAQCLAGSAALLGLLSLLEVIYGWDFRIDQLLMIESPQAAIGSVRPGLMSPITALDFVLIGVALMSLDWVVRRGFWPAQVLAVSATTLSSFAVLDFFLAPRHFHVHIALQTAVTLCILSMGVIFARPKRGLGRLLTEASQLQRQLPEDRVLRWVYSWPARYSLSLAIVFLAALLRSWLVQRTGPALPLYITFYPAVMATVVLAGAGPGIVAAFASAAAADYFFAPGGRGSGVADLSESIATSIFLVSTIGFCVLVGILNLAKKRSQAELQSERQRFRDVLDGLPVMVRLLSSSHDVVFANQAFRNTFGEPIGKKCHQYLFGKDDPCDFCQAFRVLETNTPHEWECQFPGGRLLHIFNMPFHETDGTVRVLAMDIDITEQRKAEESLKRINRTLRAMSHCTEALMKATNEAAMLQEVCDTAVGVGGYRMAWVGFAQNDPEKTVQVIAQAGFDDDYLHSVNITWADVERGQGPTGHCIRTGKVSVCRDTANDPHFAPWRDEALQRGYRSSIVLPLRNEKGVFGALSIYAPEKDAFDGREQQLLEELANSLSYAVVTLRERTERQRAEQDWKTTFDTVSDSVMLLNGDFSIRRANRATADLLGVDPGNIIGKHCYELVHGASAPVAHCPMQHMLKTRTEQRADVEEPRLGKVFDIVATPFEEGAGIRDGCIHVIRDVTARKQAENDLRKASLYARTLLESSLDPLVTISREGTITDVNQATERITGCSREQLIGSDFCAYFTDPEKARQGYCEVFTHGLVRDYSLAVRHVTGNLTEVLYNASVFRNERGEVEGVFAAARDVTELKRVEAELRKLNEELEWRVQERTAELQATFDTVPIGLSLTNDLQARHIRGNPAFEQILGVAAGSDLSKDDPACPRYRIFQDGRELDAEQMPLHRAARGELLRGQTIEILRPDGEAISVHASTAPLFDKNGKPRGAVGAFVDITPQKRAEKALRDSEQSVRRKLESIVSPEGDISTLELRDLLDLEAIQLLITDFYSQTGIPIWLLDLKGEVLAGAGWQDICMKFHRTNPSTCSNCLESDLELTKGVAPGQLRLYKCKNKMWDLVSPLMLQDRHIGNLFSGQFFFDDEFVDVEAFRMQAGCYGFDEKEYLAALARTPRLNRDNVDRGMRLFLRFAEMLSRMSYGGIKLARSLTELNRVNALLGSTNKELESFNYAVAHDLRAPLRHIHGFAKILTEEAEPVLDDSSRRHLGLINESVDHMERLLEDLLALSRLGRQQMAAQRCELRPLVDQVLADLAQETQSRNIEWRIGDLPSVFCDRGLMRQVLFNLLANAVKFTRPRNPAVIEIGQTVVDGELAFFVRDNGVGFNMKYVDKLFGLFQRLHRQQDFEGTGVGLAIVERIIHRHGGKVWAEGALDQGATIYFRLQSSVAQPHTSPAEVA